MIAVNGVRQSWLHMSRNSDLTRVACSAARRHCAANGRPKKSHKMTPPAPSTMFRAADFTIHLRESFHHDGFAALVTVPTQRDCG